MIPGWHLQFFIDGKWQRIGWYAFSRRSKDDLLKHALSLAAAHPDEQYRIVTDFGDVVQEFNQVVNPVSERLEYLRGEIIAERISYGEIAELQSLAEYIDEGDVLLREWAGIPEFEERARLSPAVVIALLDAADAIARAADAWQDNDQAAWDATSTLIAQALGISLDELPLEIRAFVEEAE